MLILLGATFRPNLALEDSLSVPVLRYHKKPPVQFWDGLYFGSHSLTPLLLEPFCYASRNVKLLESKMKDVKSVLGLQTEHLNSETKWNQEINNEFNRRQYNFVIFFHITLHDLLFCITLHFLLWTHLCTHRILKADSEPTYLVILLAWCNTETSCCHVSASNCFYFFNTTKFRF